MLRELKCQRCGGGFSARRPEARWCSTCRPIVIKSNAQRSEERHRHPCADCGVLISRNNQRCRPCGGKRGGASRTGEHNYAWKGGRLLGKDGYIYILAVPGNPKGRRYRLEHVLVWEQANDKKLPKGWVIHHLNHVKDDNRLENLEAMPRSQHNHEHGERRIRELEAEVAKLRAELDGALHPKISI